MLRFNALGDCVVYDPAASDSDAGGARWEALATQRELKRRYYMVQRARDAQVIGACVRACMHTCVWSLRVITGVACPCAHHQPPHPNINQTPPQASWWARSA